MSKSASLDSNALTYLLDAVSRAYLPQADPDLIAAERLAMFRIYCYSGCKLWVSPTVKAEYIRISDSTKRESHHVWVSYHLEDVEPPVPDPILDLRAAVLNERHSDFDDCRIVAETEATGVDILLTSDGALIKDLHAQTNVAIMRPTEFLSSLEIPRGARPCVSPAPGNPLASETWWRM